MSVQVMPKKVATELKRAASAPVEPSETELGVAEGAIVARGSFIADDKPEPVQTNNYDDSGVVVFKKPLNLGKVGNRPEDDVPAEIRRGPGLFG